MVGNNGTQNNYSIGRMTASFFFVAKRPSLKLKNQLCSLPFESKAVGQTEHSLFNQSSSQCEEQFTTVTYECSNIITTGN